MIPDFPRNAFRAERRRMVRRQLRSRGIRDTRVLAAMAWVPRERFVAADLQHQAYDDMPLRTSHGQTISQPYIVALMTAEARLTRRSRVLEIGTGTGYHTAVLANLAGAVWSVERFAEMSQEAGARLRALGITNATLVVGDGAQGHAPEAPYHAIVVTAAVPAPPARLLNQLDLGGRLVIPVGDLATQDLMIYERTPAGFDATSAGPCRFVPLVSPAAFEEP
jgi:protein-L-isoaspartate(D-aspartate) O-methyltransferase